MYDADYFLRGKETGKSLYSDYRWLPELTKPMVATIVDYCGIRLKHKVLDFGCARGYIVRAFCEFGFDACGYDTSVWALENADSKVADRLYGGQLLSSAFDWIIAKDVLEHVKMVESTIDNLMLMANVGIFAVVPLSERDGAPYVVPDYEKDITHIHRLTLPSWIRFFMRPQWEVTASYAVPGVKDNYGSWALGNGFITARRLRCRV